LVFHCYIFLANDELLVIHLFTLPFAFDAIVCDFLIFQRSNVAIKPTIYKLKISLSDLNRDIFDNFNLTIARHPSETLERMMLRVLAFCMNSSEDLVFCKGLSDTEEPDLWSHSMDGKLGLWIEVGEPSVDRIRKSSRVAEQVKIYSFNSKAPTWWQQNQGQLLSLRVSVYRFAWAQMQALAAISDRGMEISITLSDDSVFVAGDLGECELLLETLQQQ
jgi:uncharacterized protein YaeQ